MATGTRTVKYYSEDKAIYGVDYQTGSSNVWLSDGQTDMTFEDARAQAIKLWENGSNARVVGWTPYGGYFTAANYQ